MDCIFRYSLSPKWYVFEGSCSLFFFFLIKEDQNVYIFDPIDRDIFAR